MTSFLHHVLLDHPYPCTKHTIAVRSHCLPAALCFIGATQQRQQKATPKQISQDFIQNILLKMLHIP